MLMLPARQRKEASGGAVWKFLFLFRGIRVMSEAEKRRGKTEHTEGPVLKKSKTCSNPGLEEALKLISKIIKSSYKSLVCDFGVGMPGSPSSIHHRFRLTNCC
jgi:hypothetical protein